MAFVKARGRVGKKELELKDVELNIRITDGACN